MYLLHGLAQQTIDKRNSRRLGLFVRQLVSGQPRSRLHLEQHLEHQQQRKKHPQMRGALAQEVGQHEIAEEGEMDKARQSCDHLAVFVGLTGAAALDGGG